MAKVMHRRASIILSAGRSCFVKCLGCYNFFGKSESLTPIPVIAKFLAHAKEIGIEKVTIGGGDPLSRPDIICLLSQIKSIGLKINVDTVGTPFLGQAETIFFGQRQVRQIPVSSFTLLVDRVGIPLDGMSSKNIQTFRTGRPNIFDEQIRIIEALNKSKANICVNTVVHRQNYEQIPLILRMLSNFNSVTRWQCFQFMPIGPLGYKNRSFFLMADDDFERMREKVTRLASDMKLPVKIEFKSRVARKGNYLLIDTDGVSWLPNVSVSSVWDSNMDTNNQRILIGNINDERDLPKILNAVLRPEQERRRLDSIRYRSLPYVLCKQHAPCSQNYF